MITIGSSYIKRQSASSERFGGLTVSVTNGDGRRSVELTNWLNDDLIEDDVQWLIAAAWEGIDAYAAEHAVDLTSLNIRLSKIAYHPVDSRDSTFRTAAFHAFASAYTIRRA